MAEAQDITLPPLEERPLVTFALFAYNQEKYIREAVEGALRQDYTNLQIIVSDDASRDDTWRLIQETVKGYSGPHRLLINRNQVNLGLCEHVNKIFELSTGELVVMAAGDDISFTNRVSTIVKAWQACGSPESILHSAVIMLSPEGDHQFFRSPPADRLRDLNIESYLRCNLNSPILGATAAYTQGVYREFGPLEKSGSIEDGPMVFRALLLKARFIEISNPLVGYRFTGQNLSAPLRRSNLEHLRSYINRCKSSVMQHAVDLKKSGVKNSTYESLISKEYARWSKAEKLLSNDFFSFLKGFMSITKGYKFADRVYFVVNYLDLNENSLIRTARRLRLIFSRK